MHFLRFPNASVSMFHVVNVLASVVAVGISELGDGLVGSQVNDLTRLDTCMADIPSRETALLTRVDKTWCP